MRADKLAEQIVRYLCPLVCDEDMETIAMSQRGILAILSAHLPDEADTPKCDPFAHLHVIEANGYCQCYNEPCPWCPHPIGTHFARISCQECGPKKCEGWRGQYAGMPVVAAEPVSDELNETRTCVTCGFAQQAIVHMHGGDGQPLRADGHRFAAQPADVPIAAPTSGERE